MKLTLLLILANVFVFFVGAPNLNYFIGEFGVSINAINEGRYYTLLTSMFIHANLLHLLSNMFALLVLGGSVESKGAGKFLLAYFVGGIIASLSIFVPIFGYSEETILVGASGAISAIIGLGIFLNPNSFVSFPILLPIPFVIAGAIYLISTLTSLFAVTGVAYPAHLFGMLAGLIFGLVFGEKRMERLVLFIIVIILILLIPRLLADIFG